jgi:hypothetical protein
MLVKAKDKNGMKNQKHFEKELSKMRAWIHRLLILDSKKLFGFVLELPWNVYSKDNLT